MFVLILGSYDNETKKLIYSLRDCLTSKFVKEGHYFIIMEKMALFRTEDGRYVLTEEDTNCNVTLYIFNSIGNIGEFGPEMIDTIKLEGGLEETVSKYITDPCELPNMIQMDKAPITGETGLFNFLVEICSFYNIIRLKEESRGGEYLELCQILRMKDRKLVRQERDVYYFNKIGNVHSSMLNLVLNSNELVLRDFDENGDLCQQIEELVKEIHK
jgi:hypothetical protein